MRRRRNIRLLFLFSVLAVLSVTSTAIAMAASQQSTSDVFRIMDGSVVDGASSKLVRTESGISMNIQTSDLPAGHAVTVWWVVFNNPELCTHPIPGLSDCGEEDLELFGGDPAIESSVFHAAGNVIGGSGRSGFAGRTGIGDTSGALFGPGLLDPMGAEVHLVVRSHGPKIPELVSEQLKTFGAACDNALPGTGTPGPNTCADLQFSAHLP